MFEPTTMPTILVMLLLLMTFISVSNSIPSHQRLMDSDTNWALAVRKGAHLLPQLQGGFYPDRMAPPDCEDLVKMGFEIEDLQGQEQRPPEFIDEEIIDIGRLSICLIGGTRTMPSGRRTAGEHVSQFLLEHSCSHSIHPVSLNGQEIMVRVQQGGTRNCESSNEASETNEICHTAGSFDTRFYNSYSPVYELITAIDITRDYSDPIHWSDVTFALWEAVTSFLHRPIQRLHCYRS